ncbi:MAG: N-acetylmannosaminyltransferase (EC [uncultured Sulfurovum sp.]|uniref:N-acetylmannosaminyltransferase (EC) n=1 Tax=uncultured Sulfurovum sp. TaxID=269237 RepID=A0A6S6U5A8_9BACT|nr:MAG: N-acetylmannosaminyltransferase (EC [uncultured Sulfurovum sp.]
MLRNVETYAFSNRQEFLNFIDNKHKILIAINAEKILKDEAKLKIIINKNIGYSDGVGAVMALKQKGLDAVKISGAEFWLDIVRRFYKEKTFYLIGSSQEVIESTVAKLENEFQSINILGYRNGYIDHNAEKEELVNILTDKKPDIIFVAQGTPRQEYLMDELIKIHPALYMGLGGSFDIYSGTKKRAPKFFLNWHLEWFYRLLKEPTRFRRQLVLIKFFILLKMGRL